MRRARIQRVGGRIGLTWLVVVACAGSSSAASTLASPGPLPIVHAFLTALDRHDATAVCRTFSPQLQSLLVREEFPAELPAFHLRSCKAVIAQHFDLHLGSRRWVDARVLGTPKVTLEPNRPITTVDLRLAQRYRCMKVRLPRPCRPGITRQSTAIYAIDLAGGWRILKLGALLRNLEIEEPGKSFDLNYPPGDPTTVTEPVTLGLPAFACPGGQARMIEANPKVRNPESPYSGKQVSAPWLAIEALSVTRIDPSSLCVTLELAAPPRPDSQYTIFLSPAKEAEPANFTTVDFDGLGAAHVLLYGREAAEFPTFAYPWPAAGLGGDKLEIEISKPLWPAKQPALVVSAHSESLQPEEPLIPHPLRAESETPGRGCLKFPSGGISFASMCGEGSSG